MEYETGLYITISDDDIVGESGAVQPWTEPHGTGAGCSSSRANEPAALVKPASMVLDMLKCPVCTDFMLPPIFQCPNGHAICTICRLRGHNYCTACQFEFGDIRCLALEKLVEVLDVPCKYFSSGCSMVIPYYVKIKHEQRCNFRPYYCPYTGFDCWVRGDIPSLVTHLKDHHQVEMQTDSAFNHKYVKIDSIAGGNAMQELTLFYCFGQYFCLHFEAFQQGNVPVYMTFLRFMGEEEEAINYNYKLVVASNGRKVIWEGSPRSIRDSYRKVRDDNDGLIIQQNMALNFLENDKDELSLRIVGYIWEQHNSVDCKNCDLALGISVATSETDTEAENVLDKSKMVSVKKVRY